MAKKSRRTRRLGGYPNPLINEWSPVGGANSLVVQSVERRTVNPYVTGSSPVEGAIF